MGEGEGSDFPQKKVAQSDGPAVSTSTEAPKKLARQLDFTALSSGASATVVLPEHLQTQTQTVTVTVAVAAQTQPPQVLVRPVVLVPPPPPPPTQQPPTQTAQAPVRVV